MAWIHDLPSGLVALIVAAVFVGMALLGLSLTRGWSRRRGLHALVDNGVIGWIFAAIVSVYAIAIGLIAVATWGNSSAAADIASREAAQIAAIYRDFGGYPQPVRTALQEALRRYTQGIIEQDWPVQQSGRIPHRGGTIVGEIERELYRFEPRTAGQQIVHAETLRAFNRLIELRRQRLEAVDYAIPDRLWAVVLIGAMIAIGASFVFNLESLWLHAMMTGLLAGMISLLVYFIALTDLPFRGESSVTSESYELVLHDIGTPQPGQEGHP
jgi:hypothetical protein